MKPYQFREGRYITLGGTRGEGPILYVQRISSFERRLQE